MSGFTARGGSLTAVYSIKRACQILHVSLDSAPSPDFPTSSIPDICYGCKILAGFVLCKFTLALGCYNAFMQHPWLQVSED